MTSLQSASAARVAATVARSGAAVVSTTVTARSLGPGDKGTLSALLYTVMLLSFVASLGLGDAAIVLTRSGRASLQVACRSTVSGIALGSAAGGVVLSLVALASGWWSAGAMPVALALLPAATASYALTGLVVARDRLLVTSVAMALSAVAEVVAVVVLVPVLDLGIAGGVLAVLVGMAVSIAVLLPALATAGVLGRPALDRTYLGAALRFGAVNESAFLLVALAQRADMLLVYALAGRVAAGQYSVALSISQLAAYVAGAAGHSAFPRMAELPRDQLATYLARVCRLGLAATSISVIGVAIAVPVVVPLAFGDAFEPSVAPTLVLLLGAVPWSFISLVTRAAAASGAPRIRVAAYGTSLAVMAACDLIAIPYFGLVGAAAAYVAALLVGCAVAERWVRTQHGLEVRDLLPRLEDVRELAAAVRSVGERRGAGVR